METMRILVIVLACTCINLLSVKHIIAELLLVRSLSDTRRRSSPGISLIRTMLSCEAFSSTPTTTISVRLSSA